MSSRIHPAAWAAAASLVLIGGPLAWLYFSGPAEPGVGSGGKLVVFCAAGVRGPMKRIADEYREKYGQAIGFDFAGSGELYSKLKVPNTHAADLYIPGDDSYLADAKAAGLAAEVIPLAKMRAVVLVAAGNPKRIKAFADLLRPGVRLSLADPDAAAIGRLTKKALARRGKWAGLNGKVENSQSTYTPTVSKAADAVKVKAADAAIVWTPIAAMHEGLESVEMPELREVVAEVKVGVAANTRGATAALQFARFAASRDRGLPHFEAAGFEVERDAADVWADRPSVTLYSGSMLKPAIEQTVAEFADREGVDIKTVYDGCGNLIAMMESKVPDAYFSCDVTFMQRVDGLFGPATDVSGNQLVIATRRDNPKTADIKTLRGLARPGLRVGLGNPTKCAMGALTKKALETAKVWPEVKRNTVVEVAKGDNLVASMVAGRDAIDAIVVYRSNVAPQDDKLRSVAIEGIPSATPTQPFAVGRGTAHPQLMGRLLAAIRSAQSRERFKAAKFVWKLGK